MFWLLLFWSLYHFVRDVFQFLGIEHYIIDIGHREHQWCGAYCSYISLAPELFNIVAITIVLKRNRMGILGVLVLLSIPLWIILWLTP